MSNMYTLIENLCIQRGINITRMCKEANIPRGNLSDLKYGRTAELSTKNLRRVSDYFNIPLDYFLSGDETKKEHAAKSDMPNDELKFALFGGTDVTDEQFEEVKRFAEFVRQRDKK